MGFGRRWSASKPAAACLFPSLLLSLFLCSCAPGPSSFAEARQALDARLAKAAPSRSRDGAFSDAIRLAKTSTDWLSLLRRAELSERIDPPDSGRGAKVADAALAALPASADIRAACVHAYLRSRPAAANADAANAAKALALFGPVLKPEARPGLWAEAFLAVYRAGEGGGSDWKRPEYFGLLARRLGEPLFYVDAAALSLASGDRFAGRSWLELAIKGGALPPDELLWSAGLYAELARRDDAASTPSRLRLLGDAAYLSGDPDLARSRWLRALEAEPSGSWKTYASLAALSSGPEEAAYLERMRAAFPENSGALAVYAARLAREGEAAAALALLDAGLAEERPKAGPSKAPKPTSAASAPSEELSLAVRTRLVVGARVWLEERLVAQSLGAIESRPEDGKLLSLVLGSLLERKRYEDFLALEKRVERSGKSYPEDWYYEASALLLEGRLTEASSLLAKRGPPEAGSPLYLAQGRVHALRREWDKAAAAYSSALASARSGGERCAALKGLGQAREGSGDAPGARLLYLAALEADPGDVEAGLLARRELKR
jgi:hypothetical protein